MNSATSTFHHLKRRILKKFLLIFSVSSLAIGVVWACSDYDYGTPYSSFTPEAFVSADYSPFFFQEYITYYWDSYQSTDLSNTGRYNAIIINDWYNYFEKKVDTTRLKYLLLKASSSGIDSAFRNPQQFSPLKINRKKVNAFFEYLLLAKSAETFAATEVIDSWEPSTKVVPETTMEQPLLKALKSAKDPFIKQRYWFQLVRYQYFSERADTSLAVNQSKTLQVFEQYKDVFPHNLLYYRTLGYVAGWHYIHGNYALSNYLYSLCYDYSREAKVPCQWSFRPQGEADWSQTLNLAKTPQEKATLWHLLGIQYDPQRAIRNIVQLDPLSEKLDLLLSRLVNSAEYHISGQNDSEGVVNAKKMLTPDIQLVDSIALKNNTAKPYMWNMAAGYLNYLNKNYPAARSFYQKAQTQLPKGNQLLMAQYKILDWTLYVKELKRIDAAAEAKMVEPLHWFADLKAQKDTIPSLRFYRALDESILQIAALYKQQGDLLKSTAFKDDRGFYTDDRNIAKMQAFLKKLVKTTFEQAMLRYYPFDLDDLYYHQSQVMAFNDQIDEAIALMKQSNSEGTTMLANPFNMRLNDCHDCDFEIQPRPTLTAMDVLKTMKKMEAELRAGKNKYNNAYLLANAFYNISFYGNSRVFFQSPITGSDPYTPFDIDVAFRPMLLSNKVAERYYLMARDAAVNKEQKARCTFMASKCEKNESYNLVYNAAGKNGDQWNTDVNDQYFGKYFAALAGDYKDTRFYQEILKECGFFRNYVQRR